MSASPAKLAANQANAQHSTGPRTEQGKAATAQNATKSGLFSTRDFVLPHEQPIWAALDESLRADLRPSGPIEEAIVNEIRTALWRLRRCGEIESESEFAPDDAAQQSIDRARAQFNRLLQRSLAELRTLQTQRQLRREYFDDRLSKNAPGLCDWRAVYKGLIDKSNAALRDAKAERRCEDNVLDRYLLPSVLPQFTKQTQTSPNASTA
ncbi:MAG TPA: hypothetical protein VGM43_22185 [Bryobacteraceae bacterium]|jgi:hypothetical protein